MPTMRLDLEPEELALEPLEEDAEAADPTGFADPADPDELTDATDDAVDADADCLSAVQVDEVDAVDEEPSLD